MYHQYGRPQKSPLHQNKKRLPIKLLFAREPSLGIRVLFFILLSIGTMVFDYRHQLEWLRSTLSLLIVPIEYTIAWPVSFFHVLNADLSSRKALLEENTRLKAEHMLLQAKLQRLNSLEEENAQLRALLRSAPQTRSSKVLVAQQLSASPDPFIHEITLDVGTNQDVFTGQAILDSQGVMGQIIQVTPITSRALFITDTRSAIPVQNTRTGLRAILAGDGISNTLHLKHIPETADIKVGDRLICSGLGGYFPPGYPVGVVKQVSRHKGESFSTVTVTPFARFDHHQVLLIWPEQTVAPVAPIPPKTNNKEHANKPTSVPVPVPNTQSASADKNLTKR